MTREPSGRGWRRALPGLLTLAGLTWGWPVAVGAQPVVALEDQDRDRRLDTEETPPLDDDVRPWMRWRGMRGERSRREDFGPNFPPRLETVPDGEFNRVREEILRRRERIRTLTEHAEQLSQDIDQIRHRRGPRTPDHLSEVRDRLGELHGSVGEVVAEIDSARAYVRDEVVERLGRMREEVRGEIDAVGSEDPRHRDLVRLEGLLMAWEADPEAMLSLFEGGDARWRAGAREYLQQRGAPEPAVLLPRLVERIEQLERRQERLRRILESNDVEIQRLRRAVQHLAAPGDAPPGAQPGPDFP